MLSQFSLVIPEIVLTAIALLAQLFAVFYKDSFRFVSITTIIALIMLGLGLVYFIPETRVGFGGSFEISRVTTLFKAVALALAVMSIVIYRDLRKIAGKPVKMEFVILILFSVVGAFISISARDFVLLFCGLELQSLSGYALAAFNTRDAKSSEAGLKYFVLGALMSCLMLLGISLLYGFTGSMNFSTIRAVMDNDISAGLIVGIVLVLAAVLFKLSAAPLHIWTPDVYEGAPIAAVSYFSASQKIGVVAVLINIVYLVIGDYIKISSDLIKIVAILSIFIGAVGAIWQSSLKRLMAYSTVLNIGYVLMAVSLHSEAGLYGALLYIFIYVIGVTGFFACMVILFGSRADAAVFADLKGIAKHRKALAMSIAIIMFSMIGLPPLAGFIGKYYIFYSAIMQNEIMLAVFGVLTSVVAAFYYLKVIKYMYFMDPEPEPKPLIVPTKHGLITISVISVGFTMFFCIFASSWLL